MGAIPDPAVLGATVDGLQVEVDQLRRQLLALAVGLAALALLTVLLQWRIGRVREP
jgi:hypothetical protein